MKLLRELQKKDDPSQSPPQEPISEAKDSIDDDEAISVPNMSPDDPRYAEEVQYLKRLKKRDPALYNKIVGWD